MHRMLLLSCLVLPMSLPRPSLAEPPPSCTAERAGVASCMAGKLCRCDFARGGSVAGRPDGWRWDCGVLRPACGEALPSAVPMPSALPPPEVMLYLPPPPATLMRPGR